MLDAYADPHLVGLHPRGDLLLFAELLMRRRGRMDHQGLGVPDIGKMAGQLQGVDELAGIFLAALDAEVENAAESVRQVLFSKLIIRTAFQARVLYELDLRMLLQPLREGQGVI